MEMKACPLAKYTSEKVLFCFSPSKEVLAGGPVGGLNIVAKHCKKALPFFDYQVKIFSEPSSICCHDTPKRVFFCLQGIG